jgi:hypothetical protein
MLNTFDFSAILGYKLPGVNTIFRLRRYKSGNRREIVDNSLSSFSVQNRDGELIIPVMEGRFGDALFNLIQALTKVTDISFLSREVVRSTFMEDLRAFLRKNVDEARLQFDWKDEERDPTGNYIVAG